VHRLRKTYNALGVLGPSRREQIAGGGGCICGSERRADDMATILKVAYVTAEIRLRQLTCIKENNPAKFQPDPIWNKGDRIFWRASLQVLTRSYNNNNNNNKTNSDQFSVILFDRNIDNASKKTKQKPNQLLATIDPGALCVNSWAYNYAY